MRNLVWREVLPPKEQEESRNQLISAVHVKELNAVVFVSLAGGSLTRNEQGLAVRAGV